MRFLPDTHLLLWLAEDSPRLSRKTRALLTKSSAELIFSSVSLWEIAIKWALKRSDFTIDPKVVRDHLLRNGYTELPMTGHHALVVAELPRLHGDPFDRMLLAQAIVEQMILLTVDEELGRYSGPVQFAG